MQAITTKYLGATNFRGSRIKATAESGSITVDYPHEFSGVNAHAVAALALMVKLGWTGDLIGGGTKDGYVFVFAADSVFRLNADAEAISKANHAKRIAEIMSR